MLWPWNFPKYVGLTKEVDQWCHFSYFDHISENRHLVHKLHIGHLIQSLTSITPSPYPVCILLQKKVYTPNVKDINDFEIMISKEYWLFIKYSWKYFFFEIWYSKHSRHPYTLICWNLIFHCWAFILQDFHILQIFFFNMFKGIFSSLT